MLKPEINFGQFFKKIPQLVVNQRGMCIALFSITNLTGYGMVQACSHAGMHLATSIIGGATFVFDIVSMVIVLYIIIRYPSHFNGPRDFWTGKAFDREMHNQCSGEQRKIEQIKETDTKLYNPFVVLTDKDNRNITAPVYKRIHELLPPILEQQMELNNIVKENIDKEDISSNDKLCYLEKRKLVMKESNVYCLICLN
jgi:hypothetical protein